MYDLASMDNLDRRHISHVFREKKTSMVLFDQKHQHSELHV